MPRLWLLAARIISFIASFGLLHVIYRWLGPMSRHSSWTPAMQKIYDSAHRCKPWVLRTCFDEADAMQEGFSRLRPVENIPVTIISRDPDIPIRPGMSAESMEQEQKKLETLHKKQLRDFKGSRLVIAKGSNHLVQLDRPDIVASELKRMLNQLKED